VLKINKKHAYIKKMNVGFVQWREHTIMPRKNSITGLKIMLTIIIAAILITTSYYIYLDFNKTQKKHIEETPEKEIDDRISPLTSQAVFLEISRIRKKGIIDIMMKPGISWRKKPTFNYIVIFDGYEWKMPPETDFHTWDTDYIHREFFRKVKEEQQQTTIEIRIIEREKHLSHTTEKIMDSFSVVYDFRYGRWTGDDSFNDTDGYGHYNGSHYEIWFDIHQTDYDGDGIPYWIEVNVLGTNPHVDDSKLDPDNDGIPTAWEWKWGYDPFTWNNHTYLDPDNDGLQNIEEYAMAKWLANPYHPDIYIEVDFMEKAPFKPIQIKIEKGRFLPIIRPRLVKTRLDGHSHVFWEESQQMLIEKFNEHGITVHIDDGCMGGGGEFLPFMESGYSQESGIIGQYYKNNFADWRKGIFRYVVIGHGGGWCHPQDFHHYYDYISVPSNHMFYIKQTGFSITPRTQRIAQAIAVMHELGHSCGFNLTHCGGVDNMTKGSKEVWKNYKSCMNYHYFSKRLLDYSDGSHGENDCDDWGTIDLAYFQRPSIEMEGIGFDVGAPPYNRPRG